jgi:hypothetical protein
MASQATLKAKQINLQPELLDLNLYAGDGVELPITCTDGAGAPIDVSGVVKAQIRLERLTPDPPIASFAVNAVDAYQGKVIISLTGEQTMALSMDESSKAGKFVGVWDLQWTPADSQPRTLCQGKVECVADVTR